MRSVVSLEEARGIFGSDLLAAEDVTRVFGAAPYPPPLPFARDELRAAREAGDMLVLRVAQIAEAPLSILEMIQRLADAFDQRLLRQMGYQLKDDWGIELEPLAARETCSTGWALVRKEILEDTRNLAYDEQDAIIERFAANHGAPPASVRRRTAAEAVYDTLLYYGARDVRLLDKTWDWSSSRTVDGGYLNVGGFGAGGLQVLSFSRAVRHGGLGVCPTWQPLP